MMVESGGQCVAGSDRLPRASFDARRSGGPSLRVREARTRDSPSARHRQRAISARAFLIPSQVLSTLATRNRAFQRMLTSGVEIEYGTAEGAIRGATFV